MNISKQRKLILLFKTFTEKVLLPLIKKDEAGINEWHKFMSMLSAQPINFSDAQIYVDTLPSFNLLNVSTSNQPDRNLNPKKKQEKDNSDLIGFNPHKTFGGEKHRFPNVHSFDDSVEFRRESQREQSMRIKTQQSSNQLYTNTVLDGLKKLLKNMEESQNMIQKPHQLSHHHSLSHSMKGVNGQPSNHHGPTYSSSTGYYKSHHY